MAEFKIGNRLIGDGHPTYIIAEIGVNHNGIPQLAFELIDIAVDAGADAVKFQKRNLKNLYPQKYLDNVMLAKKVYAIFFQFCNRWSCLKAHTTRSQNTVGKKGLLFYAHPLTGKARTF